jgi:hypothetical protein
MSETAFGRRFLAVLVVVILGVTAAWVLAPAAPGSTAASHTSAAVAGGAHLSPSAAGHPGEALTGSAPASAYPSSRLGTSGNSLPSSDIFYPNPLASSKNAVTGAVFPSFHAPPAPMGVSDLGVGVNGTPYAYRTTSFQGTVTVGSLQAFQPGYVASPPFEAPDWALFQLNAVAVNVTYAPSAGPGVFWLQNAVHLNGTTLQLEDNIWNFSAPNASVSPTILYGNGHTYRNQFYAGFAAIRAISYPLTITLYDNVTEVGTHDVAHFGYTLVSGLLPPVSGTYDTVTFNGTASALQPPQLEVNGSSLTPSGELYDAELVLGGNGGGANTNILALNASATLKSWNHTALAYRPIRSAYDFGADSSESVLGAAVHYVGTGGTAYLGTGPSILYGLWNTTSGPLGPAASPGLLQVHLTTSAAYAFVFANVTALGGAYSYAPSSRSGTMSANLPPELNATPYSFEVLADGFAPASTTVTNSSDATQTVTLTSDPTSLTAPVYLNGTAQARELANATIPQVSFARGTLYLNATKVSLGAPFLQLNELANPTFQLFTARGVSANVSVDGFVQDPMTFNYTYYTAPVRFYSGWTQGYFFYAGSGTFSVQRVTIAGVPNLLAQPTPTLPAPTVEFYWTTASSARSITASSTAVGVTAYAASALSVSGLTVGTGAQGLAASNLSGLTVSSVNAAGLGTVGVVLAHVSNTRISGLAATGFATGLASGNSSGVSVLGLTVGLAAVGFTANATSASNVSWMNVTGGVTSSAGSWSNSVALRFSNVSISGSGLDLEGDSDVAVANGSATGFGTSVVAAFSNSSHGTFGTIYAAAGAVGLNLSHAQNVTIRGVTAAIDSTGALVNATSNVTASYVNSSVNSTGIAWTNGSHGTFTTIVTSTLSVGVWIGNASHATVTGVTATNDTLGAARYFVNPLSFLYYPIAGVGLYNATYVNVSGVVSSGYGYAVWSNGTKALDITNVQAWYDGTAVDINATTPLGPTLSKVQQVYSYGSDYGVFLQNSTYVTVSTSTLEASTTLGLEIQNGSHDSVTHSNFVANNRSSVSGGYSSSHVQAWTNNTTAASFSANYWADWGGSGDYVVNNSVKDLSPQGEFYGPYLEFTESGLFSDQAWQIGIGLTPEYNATASAIYIPGWTLPNTTLAFVVFGPLVPAPHPRYGNVTWDGSTLPAVHIQFGTPPTPLLILGLPVWAFALIVALVLLVVLVFVVRKMRRRRPPAAPIDTFDPELR